MTMLPTQANKIIAALIRVVAAAALAVSLPVFAQQTLIATVNGMVCAFCAQGIDKKLRSQPQTEDVFVDLQNRIVALQFKSGQSLPVDRIKSLIEDAGYDVVATEWVDQSAARVKAERSKKK